MRSHAAPPSLARAALATLWRVPLWAVPFALMFGTLIRGGLGGYLRAYVVSLVFSLPISACVFLNEHVVLPRVFASPPRVGTREFWIMMALYAFSSVVGAAIAAVIVHVTLLPGFLGSSRRIVISLIWAIVLTLIVCGIMMAIVFYRGALAHVRSEQELNLARRIQKSFLLSEFPAMPRLEVHAVNVSSREVSGDFYDVVPAGDGAHLIAIADVAGKGVPAALLSSMLQASLRTQADSRAPVSEILRNINALVYRSTAVHQFATFFLAHVDERTLRLSFSNAGHNHPYLIRSGQPPVALERGGTVVGILESVRFEEDVVALEPGDRVVLYTDGISEAANARGEMFGEERLIATVTALPADLPARDTTDRILGAVRGFLDGVEAGDDMTVMVLRVREPQGAST